MNTFCVSMRWRPARLMRSASWRLAPTMLPAAKSRARVTISTPLRPSRFREDKGIQAAFWLDARVWTLCQDPAGAPQRALIAQELLLFENSGSDDLLQVTDSLFQTARLTLRVPLVDAFHYGPFLADLETKLAEIFGPEVGIEMTGATVLGNRAFAVVLVSLVRSYALALIIITPLMILMIGSPRLGLISMIPNLVPAYLTLSLMGWLDIPLTISTLLVGSIIIGLAVDDTIHFLHNFDRYYRESEDAKAAAATTLETTGLALFTTSLVLALGFSIFCIGSMTGVVLFGLLASFGVTTAFLADLLISPALVVLAKGKAQ